MGGHCATPAAIKRCRVLASSVKAPRYARTLRAVATDNLVSYRFGSSL